MINIRKGRCVSVLAAAILVFGAVAASASIEAKFTELDNGLKVILHRNPQAPIVSSRIFYVTGSVHERPGNSGIAHLLEHMLFKGTKKVGIKDPDKNLKKDAEFIRLIDEVMAKLNRTPASDSAARVELQARYDSLLIGHRELFIKYELWEAYEKAGGTGLNAFTSDLMTAYIVTLPKNRLELFLWLESDRMQNAILREFYPERDVVLEERRMRVEDRPTGRYWESLMGVFYEAHPYRFPTIGYKSDLSNLTRRHAEEHYRKYYKPNNCILVLAGDIDIDETLEKVKRYFGGIPRGEEFPPVVTEEPEQPGQKRLVVRKNDAEPRLDMLFHTPGFPHDDLYALDILEGVLSGKSGRLHQKLVQQGKIALSAQGGNGVNIYTSYFYVNAMLEGNPKPESVEKAIWEVLDDLAANPISERELVRVKNQVKARSLRSLRNMEQLATELAYWEMRGGWNYINEFPERVQRVTQEEVMAVARKYFHRNHSTVGLILPEEDGTTAVRSGKKGK